MDFSDSDMGLKWVVAVDAHRTLTNTMRASTVILEESMMSTLAVAHILYDSFHFSLLSS